LPRFTQNADTTTAVQITDATFDTPHPNPEHIPGLSYWPSLRIVTIPAVPRFEGQMTGRMGDWIVTGANGEHYPCRDEIFRANYSPVTESPDTGKADRAYLIALLREQQAYHWVEFGLACSMGNKALSETHLAMHDKIKAALKGES